MKIKNYGINFVESNKFMTYKRKMHALIAVENQLDCLESRLKDLDRRVSEVSEDLKQKSQKR